MARKLRSKREPRNNGTRNPFKANQAGQRNCFVSLWIRWCRKMSAGTSMDSAMWGAQSGVSVSSLSGSAVIPS
jgi:hypothetical protein